MLIDSKTIASGITFGTATSYTSLSSGSRHLQVEPSDTATPVIDETLSLSSGSDTTVLLANFATSLKPSRCRTTIRRQHPAMRN